MISSSTKARAMIFCLAPLFLIFWSCGSSLAESDLASKNVLILHAHEANSPLFLGTDKGLSNTLQAGRIISFAGLTAAMEFRAALRIVSGGMEMRFLLSRCSKAVLIAWGAAFLILQSLTRKSAFQPRVRIFSPMAEVR